MTSMAEAVRALEGMRLAEIRRTVNLVVLVFRPDEGPDHTIHAPCAFRVLYGDVILLGSRDMYWPRERGADRDEAFDRFTTRYDAKAEFLTARFAEDDFRVTSAGIGPGGLLTVEAIHGADSIRLELVPVNSGRKVESWRLFAVGNTTEHFVYPEAAGLD
jgi:hypothetical protein